MQNNNKWLYFAGKPCELKAKMCEKAGCFFSFFKLQRASKSSSIFAFGNPVCFLKIRALFQKSLGASSPARFWLDFASQIALFCIYFRLRLNSSFAYIGTKNYLKILLTLFFFALIINRCLVICAISSVGRAPDS